MWNDVLIWRDVCRWPCFLTGESYQAADAEINVHCVHTPTSRKALLTALSERVYTKSLCYTMKRVRSPSRRAYFFDINARSTGASLCRMRLGGRECQNDGHISGIQTHASVWLTTEAWRRRRLYGRRRRKHPWMGIEVIYCIYGRLITRIRLQQNWRAPAVLRRWTAMLTNAEHFFKCQFLHVFPYKFD